MRTRTTIRENPVHNVPALAGCVFVVLLAASGCVGGFVGGDAPIEGEAIDVDGGGTADVEVSLSLSSSSGNPVDPGSFEASLSLNGGAPAAIGGLFAVTTENASAVVPDLPIGVYQLRASVADTLGMREPETVVNFTVESPAATFVGGDVMFAAIDSVTDFCFGGALNSLFPASSLVSVFDLPSFAEVEASSPQTLFVAVPPSLGGLMPIQVGIENNALTVLPQQLPPVDLRQVLGGLVPCVLHANAAGRFLRTSPTTGNIRLFFFDVTFTDSPGESCWLPDPLAGCVSWIDLGGFDPNP